MVGQLDSLLTLPFTQFSCSEIVTVGFTSSPEKLGTCSSVSVVVEPWHGSFTWTNLPFPLTSYRKRTILVLHGYCCDIGKPNTRRISDLK